MKKLGGQKNHMVDILFTLALFCVFAASSLIVVVIGADVYQKTAADMEQNFGARTSVSYIAEKVRQSDGEGMIRVGQVAGQDALVLGLAVGDRLYETWIYCDNGQLKEVLLPHGNTPGPSDGQAIMAARGLDADEVSEGVYSVTVTAQNGEKRELLLTSRSR